MFSPEEICPSPKSKHFLLADYKEVSDTFSIIFELDSDNKQGHLG